MSPPDAAPPPKAATDKLFFRVFPPLMLPMFLGVVDQTIVATALPAISADLGEVERISWVVIAYLIAATVAAPVYGRLGDFLGRRRMMFVALGVVGVSSLMCAASPTLPALAFARVLQGLGGGGLMALAQSLIGEAVPPRERARYQGYLATVFVTSNAFGPLAGGYLTEAFGWRSIFLVNLPVALLAAWLVRRFLEAKPPGGESFRFDFPGLGWFVLFIVPALLGLERIQSAGTPFTPAVGALIGVSLASLALLLRRERRAPHPLLPFALLRKPDIWRPDALAACHGAALVSLITFVPIYLRAVRGAPASEIGLLMLPIAIGIGTGSMVTGRLVSVTGRTTIFPALALIPVVGLLLLLAVFPLSLAGVATTLAICAFLMGSVMGVVQVTVQSAAGMNMLGAATGSVAFSRSVGAAFGTALASMLLFASVGALDPEAGRLFGALVEHGPAALDALAPEARAGVLAATARGFGLVFALIAGYVAVGCALAWSIPSKRLGP